MDASRSFTGSMPDYYDRFLGPAWIEAYADDLVARIPPDPGADVLETACGTGLVTTRLRKRVAPSRRIIATDLSKAMLDYARAKYPALAGVEWREADAMRLPFADASFGAVVCGFGVMFPPDRAAAVREARRVLRPGGLFAFSVWDRIEENTTAWTNSTVVEAMFPGDEEVKMRMPFELHDPAELRKLIVDAGFREKVIERREVPIDGLSARDIATGQIRGTPRSNLIEKRGGSLDTVIDKVAAELARVGGANPYRSVARALIVEAIA
jgi:ubiquinone/menaquinone biosynthesis C-methylase UbiE